VNPYGVAFVESLKLATMTSPGRTIVRVNKNADPTLFFTSELIGLSTALGALDTGFVIVGNVPSTGTGDQRGVCTPGPNGEMQDVGQGALQIIDRQGKLVKTLTSSQFLDGPWDLTVKDEGWRALVFVSNVLSGTVTRLDLRVWGKHVHVASETQIASGYTHRCDPGAFVVGPTGVALERKHDVLYVASTADNIIYAIDDASDTRTDAGRGRVVVDDQAHLHGPLGLALAPNGDLVSAQGDAVNPNPDPNGQSLIVEFTPEGQFVAQFSAEPTTPGAAFGVAVETRGRGFRFAAVDDALNVLDLWVVHSH
jgi:DNA-binding beta-propeller fold protein YncE